MYREISRSEALQAVLDDKKVFTISVNDSYLWLDDFSKVLDGRRYMVDDDVIINPSQEKQVEEPSNFKVPEENIKDITSKKQVKSVEELFENKTVDHRKDPKPIKRTCKICGKKFMGSNRSYYCSDECRKAAMKKVTVVPPAADLKYTDSEETIRDCKHKDCTYRGNGSGCKGSETCDYLLKTGFPRGCDFETCDKYKPRAGNERKHI